MPHLQTCPFSAPVALTQPRPFYVVSGLLGSSLAWLLSSLLPLKTRPCSQVSAHPHCPSPELCGELPRTCARATAYLPSLYRLCSHTSPLITHALVARGSPRTAETTVGSLAGRRQGRSNRCLRIETGEEETAESLRDEDWQQEAAHARAEGDGF